MRNIILLVAMIFAASLPLSSAYAQDVSPAIALASALGVETDDPAEAEAAIAEASPAAVQAAIAQVSAGLSAADAATVAATASTLNAGVTAAAAATAASLSLIHI